MLRRSHGRRSGMHRPRLKPPGKPSRTNLLDTHEHAYFGAQWGNVSQKTTKNLVGTISPVGGAIPAQDWGVGEYLSFAPSEMARLQHLTYLGFLKKPLPAVELRLFENLQTSTTSGVYLRLQASKNLQLVAYDSGGTLFGTGSILTFPSWDQWIFVSLSWDYINQYSRVWEAYAGQEPYRVGQNDTSGVTSLPLSAGQIDFSIPGATFGAAGPVGDQAIYPFPLTDSEVFGWFQQRRHLYGI